MRHLVVFLLSILLFVHDIAAQGFTISGYIQDKASGERLPGVLVVDLTNQRFYTYSNEYGFFSLTLPRGRHVLYFSFPGYVGQRVELNLTADRTINVELPTSVDLEAVDVVAEKQVQSAQMSKVNISMRTVDKLPMLLGEADVLKAVQMLPGVQSGVEGTSGFMVRGGSPDQNLILLDGVPVYNVSHLFGFFSVFTPEAIKSVNIIKGGFPARYGGRLSSVLDIRMKEGDMHKFHAEASVGLISSKIIAEGPIKKDTASFIVTARRTYADLLAKPVINYLNNHKENKENIITGGYYFYDLNAKVNTRIGKNDRVYLSLYGGQDKAFIQFDKNHPDYYFGTKWTLQWGNMISALRWNHRFSNKIFANTTFTYSRFNFLTSVRMNIDDYRGGDTSAVLWDMNYSSGIYDIGSRVDIDYLPSATHKIKTGLSFVFHTFRPGISAFNLSGGDISIDTTYGNGNIYGREGFVYIEDNINAASWLKLNLGFHLSAFSVRDTVFISPEPRFSASILLSHNWSVKASYARMQQYVQLLSTTNMGLPMDIWLPATDIVLPQRSQQYAVGSVWRLEGINFSVEGFYKTMDNLVEMKEGESIFGDRTTGKTTGEIWEQKVVQGKGWAYGGELFVQKNAGRFTGWLAYTLSWTWRQFDSLNFGRKFPYRYDRRHDLKTVFMYRINDRWTASLTWVYNTGIAITVPLEQYISVRHTLNPSTLYSPNYLPRNTIQYFQYRNNYRLPPYHRMDISFSYSRTKKGRKSLWTFGIYNLYNRQNPFFVQFDYYTDPPTLYQYSIFQIMPFFSYKIFF